MRAADVKCHQRDTYIRSNKTVRLLSRNTLLESKVFEFAHVSVSLNENSKGPLIAFPFVHLCLATIEKEAS